MTVAELIAELEKKDADAEVFVNGHPDGGGLDAVCDVMDEGWVKHQGYYCSYSGSYFGAKEGEAGAVKAIRIV